MFQFGAFNMDMFGKLEFTLEVSFSNPLIQIGFFCRLAAVCAAHRQQIIVRGDLKFLLGKAGNRNGNAIMILVNQLNIVGRITISLTLPGLQRVK